MIASSASELGQCVQRALAGRDEQEQDLLLGERLELVDPVGRRVRDPVDAAVLRPGRDARQVVGERVPVVRRHRQARAPARRRAPRRRRRTAAPSPGCPRTPRGALGPGRKPAAVALGAARPQTAAIRTTISPTARPVRVTRRNGESAVVSSVVSATTATYAASSVEARGRRSAAAHVSPVAARTTSRAAAIAMSDAPKLPATRAQLSRGRSRLEPDAEAASRAP